VKEDAESTFENIEWAAGEHRSWLKLRTTAVSCGEEYSRPKSGTNKGVSCLAGAMGSNPTGPGIN